MGSTDLSDLEVFDALHEYGVFLIPDLASTFQETANGVRCYPLMSDTEVRVLTMRVCVRWSQWWVTELS